MTLGWVNDNRMYHLKHELMIFLPQCIRIKLHCQKIWFFGLLLLQKKPPKLAQIPVELTLFVNFAWCTVWISTSRCSSYKECLNYSGRLFMKYLAGDAGSALEIRLFQCYLFRMLFDSLSNSLNTTSCAWRSGMVIVLHAERRLPVSAPKRHEVGGPFNRHTRQSGLCIFEILKAQERERKRRARCCAPWMRWP